MRLSMLWKIGLAVTLTAGLASAQEVARRGSQPALKYWLLGVNYWLVESVEWQGERAFRLHVAHHHGQRLRWVKGQCEGFFYATRTRIGYDPALMPSDRDGFSALRSEVVGSDFLSYGGFAVSLPAGTFAFSTLLEGATVRSKSDHQNRFYEFVRLALLDFDGAVKEFERSAGGPAWPTSNLKVLSQPGGADVYLDGKLMGTTSADRGELALGNLPPGSSSLRVTASGYQDWTQSLTLTVGNTVSVEVRMVQAVSSLSLQTMPGNVQVYLDDLFKGITSEQEGRLKIEGLAPGDHRVRLTLPGYKEWSQPIALAAGALLPLTVKLEPAGPKPLTFDEVEEALKNGISKKRVAELTKQFGVDFTITAEQEQRLRGAGADGELLYLISKSKK